MRHDQPVSADELREWREAVTLTQRDLADYLGVTTTTISRWETGAVPMPPYLRFALLWIGRHMIDRTNIRKANAALEKGAQRG